MKAIVYYKYGSPDVLQLEKIEKPVPKDNEILIKIRATTVTSGDCENRRFKFPVWTWLFAGLILGFRKPKRPILGQELAGDIEAVGNEVSKFKVGDAVFAATRLGFGAHVEYICLPEDWLIAIKPSNMSYEEAAAAPTGALNALRLLRKANIETGHKVLINGAGGSIGTFAIQLAKHFGAEVTAVDSTKKLAMIRELGADHVIDYTQEDFTRRSDPYDVILDTVGTTTFSQCIRLLHENGFYLIAHPSLTHLIRGLWTTRRSSRTIVTEIAKYQTEDLIFLKELIEAGKIKAVMDRQYAFEQIPDAHRYVESGHKVGNVVITVAHSP